MCPAQPPAAVSTKFSKLVIPSWVGIMCWTTTTSTEILHPFRLSLQKPRDPMHFRSPVRGFGSLTGVRGTKEPRLQENGSRECRSRAEGNRCDASLRVARRCAGGKSIGSVCVRLRGEEGVLRDQGSEPLLCNRWTMLKRQGYERANSSSDSTSFSLASNVRSAARYRVRASP